MVSDDLMTLFDEFTSSASRRVAFDFFCVFHSLGVLMSCLRLPDDELDYPGAHACYIFSTNLEQRRDDMFGFLGGLFISS